MKHTKNMWLVKQITECDTIYFLKVYCSDIFFTDTALGMRKKVFRDGI